MTQAKVRFQMRIVKVDSKIIKELRRSGISQEMRSLESSDWLVLAEIDKKIIGASGVGGIFNLSNISLKNVGIKSQNHNFPEKDYGANSERATLARSCWATPRSSSGGFSTCLSSRHLSSIISGSSEAISTNQKSRKFKN